MAFVFLSTSKDDALTAVERLFTADGEKTGSALWEMDVSGVQT